MLACPLTEATRGMLAMRQLKRMKPTAVLINVARAEVADEADLYAALEGRRHRRRRPRRVVPLSGVDGRRHDAVALSVRRPRQCPHDAAFGGVDRRGLGAALRRLRRQHRAAPRRRAAPQRRAPAACRRRGAPRADPRRHVLPDRRHRQACRRRILVSARKNARRVSRLRTACSRPRCESGRPWPWRSRPARRRGDAPRPARR